MYVKLFLKKESDKLQISFQKSMQVAPKLMSFHYIMNPRIYGTLPYS